jgi:hypothetical protein
MSGGGSKTEYVTSNRTTEPAAFIKPFLEYGANEAQRLYQSELPQYYPQSTVVGFAPQQEMALRGIEQRALAGSPLTAAAQQNLASTLGGSFLSGGNPYLQQAIQNAAQPTIDAVQSQFSAAGRLGSGANMDVLSRNVGQIAQNMAFANYNDERTRQMQALGMAPAMAAQDYADFNALAGVGDARRQQSQAELQDQVNRWNFEQNTPAEKLAKYMALVGGGQFGSTGTDTRPVFSNPLAEGLGLATGAAGLGNMLFGRGGGLTAPGLLRGANGNIFGMG